MGTNNTSWLGALLKKDVSASSTTPMRSEDKDASDSARHLVYLLIAAGVAVALWMLFAQTDSRPHPSPADEVIMTCTCRPTQ